MQKLGANLRRTGRSAPRRPVKSVPIEADTLKISKASFLAMAVQSLTMVVQSAAELD